LHENENPNVMVDPSGQRQGEVENWMQLEGFALMRQRVECISISRKNNFSVDPPTEKSPIDTRLDSCENQGVVNFQGVFQMSNNPIPLKPGDIAALSPSATKRRTRKTHGLKAAQLNIRAAEAWCCERFRRLHRLHFTTTEDRLAAVTAFIAAVQSSFPATSSCLFPK